MKTSFKILSILALVVISATHLLPESARFQLATVPLSSQAVFSEDSPVAVWEWRSITNFSDSEIVELLDYVQKKGIDVIFLSIDEYIDIVEIADLSTKEVEIAQFNYKLHLVLKNAVERNIKIYALAGHPYWSSETYRYIAEELTLFVIEYNSGRNIEDGHLLGIQFDIEPHSLDEYNQLTAYNYLSDLQKTVDLVALTYENNSTSTLDIGFAIPFWLDEESKLSPLVDWNGNKKTTFYHVTDRLADLPNSHIALMAYRNIASGQNGTLEISSGEFDYIDRMNYSTKIWVGQEITNVNPTQISFFNSRWSQILREFKVINSALVGKVEYAGIIINDLMSLEENYKN